MRWAPAYHVSSSIALAVGAKAIKSWASIPIHGRTRLTGDSLNRHYAEVLVGAPLQNISLAVDVATPNFHVHTLECTFCPPEVVYDPGYSSTATLDMRLIGNKTFGSEFYGGSRGSETVVLGGILRAMESPIDFVDHMSLRSLQPVTGGIVYRREGVTSVNPILLRPGNLGLFVPPIHDSPASGFSAVDSVLTRLHEQGQLLNPVWGLSLGRENPRLTIGALDPNDYQGEINWVPVLTDGGYPVIEVDTLRGYQGNVFPYQYPIKARLDSYFAGIGIPDLATYITNQTLLGPQELTELIFSNKTFVVRCDDMVMPNIPVELSVEINGIVYPLSAQEISMPSAQPNQSSATKVCNVRVYELDDPLHEYGLGLSFVRSMYIAYRFPTQGCPGYWGFALPKGSPTPTVTQKPRTTPTDTDTCLSLIKPSSTPTPTITPYPGLLGSSGERYPVYAQPDDQWVELWGVGDLKLHKATGKGARKESQV